MANIQYIGARYVPKFYVNPDDSSNDWKSGESYEPLTVVTYLDDSYTSKIAVPASVGNPANNSNYWVKTGNYNAAVSMLQNKVLNLENQNGSETLETNAQTLSGAINELNELSVFVTPEMFGAKGDGVTDDTTAIQNALDSNTVVVFSNKTYRCKNVVVNSNNVIIGNNATLKIISGVSGDIILDVQGNNVVIRDISLVGDLHVGDGSWGIILLNNNGDYNYYENIALYDNAYLAIRHFNGNYCKFLHIRSYATECTVISLNNEISLGCVIDDVIANATSPLSGESNVEGETVVLYGVGVQAYWHISNVKGIGKHVPVCRLGTAEVSRSCVGIMVDNVFGNYDNRLALMMDKCENCNISNIFSNTGVNVALVRNCKNCNIELTACNVSKGVLNSEYNTMCNFNIVAIQCTNEDGFINSSNGTTNVFNLLTCRQLSNNAVICDSGDRVNDLCNYCTVTGGSHFGLVDLSTP